MYVRWVPQDRLLPAVKYAVRMERETRLVICPIGDLPEDHPVHQRPYVHVHPDGFVELWQYDVVWGHILHKTIERFVPKPETSETSVSGVVLLSAA
jgi:hypothetical protein